MDKIHVIAKRDHLESLTTVKRPLDAVAQLVWNGLDALSDRVQVSFDTNGMGGLETIRIRDYGTGIAHNEAAQLFDSLGDSWKKEKRRLSIRSLHGKNGKGRFKAFGLGSIVEWNTTYRDNGGVYGYTITGKLAALDDFESTAPRKVQHAQTGTEVVISNLARNFRSLLDDDEVAVVLRVVDPAMLRAGVDEVLHRDVRDSAPGGSENPAALTSSRLFKTGVEAQATGGRAASGTRRRRDRDFANGTSLHVSPGEMTTGKGYAAFTF